MVASLRGFFSSQSKIQDSNSQGFQGAKIRNPRAEVKSVKEDAVKLQLSSAAPTTTRGAQLSATSDPTTTRGAQLSATSDPTSYTDYAKKQKSIGGPLQGGDDEEDDRRLGDIDGDGFVNESDFKILFDNIFTEGGRDQGDLNGDGLVDGSDFNILNANKDTTPANPPITSVAGAEVDPGTLRAAEAVAGGVDPKSVISAESVGGVVGPKTFDAAESVGGVVDPNSIIAATSLKSLEEV